MKNTLLELGITPKEREIIIDKVINLIKSKQPNIIEKIIINEEECAKLNLAKESLAMKIRDYVCATFPDAYKSIGFDSESNVLFELTENENSRRTAIECIEQNELSGSIYLEESKALIVTDCGCVIGQVTNVEPDNIEEAAKMVREFDGMCGIIQADYQTFKDFYLSKYEEIEAWQLTKIKLKNVTF